MFEKGILIIRNPLDCFIAEYNRVLQNHFEYAPLRKWNEIEDIDEFFFNYMFPKWMELHENIIKTYKNPLHVVEYESLKKDPIRILSEILGFLNIEMTEGTRKCLSDDHDGPFHRPKRPQRQLHWGGVHRLRARKTHEVLRRFCYVGRSPGPKRNSGDEQAKLDGGLDHRRVHAFKEAQDFPWGG